MKRCRYLKEIAFEIDITDGPALCISNNFNDNVVSIYLDNRFSTKIQLDDFMRLIEDLVNECG